MGEEDGGQAGEGAGETVFSSAETGESPTERGKLKIPADSEFILSDFFFPPVILICYVFVGKAETERRQPETACGE